MVVNLEMVAAFVAVASMAVLGVHLHLLAVAAFVAVEAPVAGVVAWAVEPAAVNKLAAEPSVVVVAAVALVAEPVVVGLELAAVALVGAVVPQAEPFVGVAVLVVAWAAA